MDKKPEEFIPTRKSLLGRLKNWDDQDSWREFFNIYRRLIFSTAIRAGLTEQEAEDVVQETVISVAKTIKEFRYDRDKCTFKTWLRHLTQKRIVDQFRKRPREQRAKATTTHETARTSQVERVPDPNATDVEAVWEEEWQRKLLHAAIDNIKKEVNAEHYQAFDLYVLKKVPATKVASALGVNVAQVYLARHRVAKLIKKEVKRLERRMSWQQPCRDMIT